MTNETKSDPHIVFVVHGRNDTMRDALFAFLRSIGLKPLEWAQAVKNTGKASPYIGEILETAFSAAQAIVVLMTPDDEARLRTDFQAPNDPSYETRLTPQARSNVLFEAGMAMGHNPDRTILIELGELRPFSDVAGRHAIRLNNSAERRHELAQRLKTAGCSVEDGGTDWLKVGDFNIEVLHQTEEITGPAVEALAKEIAETLATIEQPRERWTFGQVHVRKFNDDVRIWTEADESSQIKTLLSLGWREETLQQGKLGGGSGKPQKTLPLT